MKPNIIKLVGIAYPNNTDIQNILFLVSNIDKDNLQVFDKLVFIQLLEFSIILSLLLLLPCKSVSPKRPLFYGFYLCFGISPCYGVNLCYGFNQCYGLSWLV